jgi:predicted patatin/cPLA2 family phospholipase
MLRFYRKYPEFAQALARSDRDYNRQCDEIEQLEDDGRVFVLKPSSKVMVGRIEGDMEKLGSLYWQGYRDTMNRIGELREYLQGTVS